MSPWEHLTEVPTDVRHTMTTAFIGYEKQDLGVETIVEMLQMPHVTNMTCRALRLSANSVRVPELCRTVKDAHPEVSWRNVFKAVGFFVGLDKRSVARLFYGGKQCSKSK